MTITKFHYNILFYHLISSLDSKPFDNKGIQISALAAKNSKQVSINEAFFFLPAFKSHSRH